MRCFAALLLLFAGGSTLLTAGCSSFSTSADYDTTTDFSKYRTWTWFEGPKPGGALDGLTEKRIRTSLEAELPARGLTKAGDGADLLVTYHVSVHQKIAVTPTTMTYGYGWGRGYAGVAYGNEVRVYDEGTLLLDLLDGKTKTLIWRGTARGTVYEGSSPEDREQRIRDAVQQTLAVYPPLK